MPTSFLLLSRRVALLFITTGLLLSCRRPQVTAPPSQVQLTRQFLLAVLSGKYQNASQLMAPDAPQASTRRQFEADAQLLHAQGKRFGPAIELHKLGFRIGDTGHAQPFYAFSFKSDTQQTRPQVMLDVMFRDSSATRIQRFGLVPAPQKQKKK